MKGRDAFTSFVIFSRITFGIGSFNFTRYWKNGLIHFSSRSRERRVKKIYSNIKNSLTFDNELI